MKRLAALGVAWTMMVCLLGCPPPDQTGDVPADGITEGITITAGDDKTLFVEDTGAATAVVTGATGTVSYQWVMTLPGRIVSSTTAATVTFTAASAGTATLTVTVSDSGTNTIATDDAQITFNNPPLTVDAGADQFVAAGGTVLLRATAAGGVPPYSFQWLRLSGPVQPFSPPDGRSTSITVAGSTPGTVGFQVTVTDSASSTASDDVLLAIESAPPSTTFTLDLDDLTGTGGDDVFHAPALDPASSGTFLPTLQTGDRANGLSGSDVLDATFAGPAGPAIVPAAITDIETVNVTDIATGGPQPISAVNFSNVTSINSINSVNPLTLLEVPAPVNLALINAKAGINVQFKAGVVAGTADSLELTLSNVSAESIQFNGVETLNLFSTVAPNTLGTIVGNNVLATVNAGGDQPLVITKLLPDQVTTFNAAASSGGVSVSFGQGNAKFVGGSGNDSVSFLQFDPGDSADGGAGHDALQIPAADALAVTVPPPNVAGFEELAITTPLAGDLNANLFGTIDTLRLQAGINAEQQRRLTVRPGANVVLQEEISGAAPGVLMVSTASITITIDSTAHSPATAPPGAPLIQGIGCLDPITGLNLIVLGDGQDRRINAISTVDSGGDETLTISGTSHQTTEFVRADVVDASGLAGGLTLRNTNPGGLIIGTPNNDELGGFATDNTIDAGAGNDQVRGFEGVDRVTLGPGADRLFLTAAGAGGVDRKIVTDFDATPTTGDVLVLEPTVFVVSGTDNFSTSAAIEDHGTGTVIPQTSTKLLRITGATLSGLTGATSLNGTNLLAAMKGGIVVIPGNAYLVAIKSIETPVIALPTALIIPPIFRNDKVGLYYGRDADMNAQLTAGELTLIAVLQGPNVRLENLVFQNFSN